MKEQHHNMPPYDKFGDMFLIRHGVTDKTEYLQCYFGAGMANWTEMPKHAAHYLSREVADMLCEVLCTTGVPCTVVIAMRDWAE